MNSDVEEQAAEYVLGTLEGQARQQFEQQMERDARLAAQVLQWEGRLAPLSETVNEVTPPGQVWRGIERRLGFVEEKRGPSFWNRVGLWQGVSAVATAFGVWLAFLLVSTVPVTPEMIYLIEDQGRTEWVVRASHQQQQITLKAIEPPQLSDGQLCKLWVTLPDGSIHPLGVLPHDGSITLSAISEQLLSKDVELSVTIEPARASVEPLPSGPVVSKGKWITL